MLVFWNIGIRRAGDSGTDRRNELDTIKADFADGEVDRPTHSRRLIGWRQGRRRHHQQRSAVGRKHL
jgi:hypothetical protein